MAKSWYGLKCTVRLFFYLNPVLWYICLKSFIQYSVKCNDFLNGRQFSGMCSYFERACTCGSVTGDGCDDVLDSSTHHNYNQITRTSAYNGLPAIYPFNALWHHCFWLSRQVARACASHSEHLLLLSLTWGECNVDISGTYFSYSNYTSYMSLHYIRLNFQRGKTSVLVLSEYNSNTVRNSTIETHSSAHILIRYTE